MDSSTLSDTQRQPEKKAKDPLVSIIVPTYCEEKNIKSCLKSVKKQKFEKKKIEVIVVDSNSPDNTKNIAEMYADSVVNIKERGVSRARNIGAKKAKGKILLFLDADTSLDLWFLAEICKNFADPNIVCVSGALVGLEKSGMVDNLFKVFHYSLVNKIAAFTAHLGFPFFPTVCCACRKSVFNKIGGFDEKLAIAEDLAFSLKTGKAGKCLLNKRAKAYTSLRRFRKNGRMKNYFAYFKNYFKVFVLNQKPWINEFPHTQEIKS